MLLGESVTTISSRCCLMCRETDICCTYARSTAVLLIISCCRLSLRVFMKISSIHVKDKSVHSRLWRAVLLYYYYYINIYSTLNISDVTGVTFHLIFHIWNDILHPRQDLFKWMPQHEHIHTTLILFGFIGVGNKMSPCRRTASSFCDVISEVHEW